MREGKKEEKEGEEGNKTQGRYIQYVSVKREIDSNDNPHKKPK